LSDFEPDIATSTLCAHCTADVPLEAKACPICSTPAPPRLGFHAFFAEIERRRIMDARFGGLVLGRTGAEDDIPLFQHQGRGVFVLAGLMQGGEYILSAEATEHHKIRLIEINSEKGEPPNLPLSPQSMVIDTNLMPSLGGLWIAYGGQFIINRFATTKYFNELEALNVSSIVEALR
jgi:hypothetical protein